MKSPHPSRLLTVRRMLLLAGLCASSACSHGDGQPIADEPGCLAVEQQAVVAGSAEETYLGLLESQRRAVVELVDGTGATDKLCTGTFVTPGWVMSAAHCLAIPQLTVRVQKGSDAPSASVPVAYAERHQSRDLVLLQVDFASADARVDGAPITPSDPIHDVRDVGVAPIPASTRSPVLTPGDAVELAGFGLDEAGISNALTFVVEQVVAVEATRVSVDGFGTSGACEGDSGGPLLLRSRGALAVRGVLSTGSASCRGVDHYVRVDDITDWVEIVAGRYAADERDCGAFTERGRCLYGSALFCLNGERLVQTCEEDRHCGWDVEQLRFGCVPPGSDPCAGADGVGSCRGDIALRCDDDGLKRSSCAPCGACRVDGKTGAPFCGAAPPPSLRTSDAGSIRATTTWSAP